MNIHHLELFYYVAGHGGISEAVRKIPCGIQQPAVSGQIAQLEEFLGATHFHRRMHAEVLLELPLVLIVPAASPLRNAEKLWLRDKISEPWLCLPPTEAISRNFQQSLNRFKIDWFPSIETYVADGFGVGLSVSIPKTKMSLKILSFVLKGLAPVVLGALWRGKTLTAIADIAG